MRSAGPSPVWSSLEDPSRRPGVVHRRQQEGVETVNRTAYVAFILATALPVAAMAQNRGSADDQLACTPDVYRLCSGDIPDEDAITACLEQHKQQLGAGCRAVFSGPSTPKAKPQDDD